MFTGIITEIGEVKKMRLTSGGARLEISSDRLSEGLALGDSVSVNGVCLSAVGIGKALSFDVVKNTLSRTGLKRLRPGDKVNLEGPLKMGDNISGHIVTGHIDGERKIRKNSLMSKGWEMDIALAEGDTRYAIPRGSIAIDGVSLTIAECLKGSLSVYIIPVTLSGTILKLKKKGDYVNVEFDMAAKISGKTAGSGISEEMLRKTGFM
ncbi:MAG: riboflavin synthase [Candidatus Omnitrophica bacterium]|nr:riboflavin synthase [Candidatus Omnitrophota bacterium]